IHRWTRRLSDRDAHRSWTRPSARWPSPLPRRMWPGWASSSRPLHRDVLEAGVWRMVLLHLWAVRTEPLGLRHQLVCGVLQATSLCDQFVGRLGEFLDEG